MFQLPLSTLVNRKIPKNKFYEKLNANQHLKELFTEQVESIIWKHKLSKETIHLAPKDDITEIQVFEVYLKGQTCSPDILRSIDAAIPYPILHILMHKDQARLAIAYKERSLADDNRSVIRSYHQSAWLPVEGIKLEILQGLDLKAVYENIIRNLLPIKAKPEMELTAVLERQARLDKLKQECQRLESKIRTEKQFNRKVELNIELQRKQRELKQLYE